MKNSGFAFWVLAQAVYKYQIGLRNYEAETEAYFERRSAIHSETAQLLLDLSHKNKGLYLKFGQYLGNLERVIPK